MAGLNEVQKRAVAKTTERINEAKKQATKGGFRYGHMVNHPDNEVTQVATKSEAKPTNKSK